MKNVILTAALVFMTSFAFAEEEVKDLTGSTACLKCDYDKESGATKCVAGIKVGDKVYALTGPVLKKEMPGCCGTKGTYTVSGKLSKDGKAIEVSEIKKKG